MYYCLLLGSTFVVEQKHGFNKSTLLLFFQDKLMSLSLLFVLSMPILSVVVWLVRLGGEYFYFYVWIFLLVVRYCCSKCLYVLMIVSDNSIISAMAMSTA